MKHKFTVIIEETVAKEFEIFAKDAEEALRTAKENYKKGKFVLEPGNVNFRQMALITSDGDTTEWIEF